MDRYRVWEANRKVFLFPENWLLPELRDDKTATFRQLEGALSKQEPSPDATQEALLGYVKELSDLAQISVIAMYQENETLYVVGRTPDQPNRYYWRACSTFGADDMIWSGWEALDLGNANDFIMPFVFDGDLHVAWPIFRETTLKDKDDLRWDTQLAWLRHTKQGWTKRKLSRTHLNVRRLLNKDAPSSFTFRLSKAEIPWSPAGSSASLTREKINIRCYAVDEQIRTMQPNPSFLKDAHPTGEHITTSFQWNVSLRVHGFVYEYATASDDGTVFNRALKGASVVVTYDQQEQGGTATNIANGLKATPHSSDGSVLVLPSLDNGEFTVDIPAPNNTWKPENVWEGVMNGSAITLTVTPPGGKEINVHATLGDQTTGLFKDWIWNINVGVENPAIKADLLATRAVGYFDAGSFIMESGTDVRDEGPVSGVLPDTKPQLLVGASPAFPGGGHSYTQMLYDGNRYRNGNLTNLELENVRVGVEPDLSQVAVPALVCGSSIPHARDPAIGFVRHG